METILQQIYTYATIYGVKILSAILIFVIGKWVAKLVSQILEKIMIKSKVDQTLASFTKNLVNALLLVFIVIAALGQLGIQTASFVAVIGAAGLAIGMALQGSLANFASGVMIIIFRTIKVGDMIEAGGVSGTVSEIQIFNTILLTTDQKKIILPNSKITGDKITIFLKPGN